ncbi:MAG: invasin domain 3-containing protein [Thermoanaerobaculia bacterium]
MRWRLTTLAGALLLFALLPGCDSASPTGPRTVLITVTAMPASIGVGETSTITITVIDSDGNPIGGIPTALTTTLGTLEETSLDLDAMGHAETMLEGGMTAGTATVSATVTYLGVPTTGAGTVAITEPPGELDVQPRGLDLTHSRSTDPCPNPFLPMVSLMNAGVADLDYRVVDDLPDWLTVDSMEGEVPAMLQAEFNCDVGDGDMDLEHFLQIQGVDRASGDDVGDPQSIAVTLQVRD